MSRLPTRIPFPGARAAQEQQTDLAVVGGVRETQELQGILQGVSGLIVGEANRRVQQEQFKGAQATADVALQLAKGREVAAGQSLEAAEAREQLATSDASVRDAAIRQEALQHIARIGPHGVLDTIAAPDREAIEAANPLTTDELLVQATLSNQGKLLWDRSGPAFMQWVAEQRLEMTQSLMRQIQPDATPEELDAAGEAINDEALAASGMFLSEDLFTADVIAPMIARITDYHTQAGFLESAYNDFYALKRDESIRAIESQTKRLVADLDDTMQHEIGQGWSVLDDSERTAANASDLLTGMQQKWDDVAEMLGGGQVITNREVSGRFYSLVLQHMTVKELERVQGLASDPSFRLYFGKGGDYSVGKLLRQQTAQETRAFNANVTAKAQFVRDQMEQFNEVGEGTPEERLRALTDMRTQLVEGAVRIPRGTSITDQVAMLSGVPGDQSNAFQLPADSPELVILVGDIDAEIRTIETQSGTQLAASNRFRFGRETDPVSLTQSQADGFYATTTEAGTREEDTLRGMYDTGLTATVPTGYRQSIMRAFDTANLNPGRGVDLLTTLRDVDPVAYRNIIWEKSLAEIGVPDMMDRLDEALDADQRAAVMSVYSDPNALNTFFDAEPVATQENLELPANDRRTHLTAATVEDPNHQAEILDMLSVALEDSGLDAGEAGGGLRPGEPRAANPSRGVWLRDFKREFQFQYAKLKHLNPDAAVPTLSERATDAAVRAFRDRYVPVTSIDASVDGTSTGRTELVRASLLGIGSLQGIRDDADRGGGYSLFTHTVFHNALHSHMQRLGPGYEAHVEAAVRVDGTVLIPIMPEPGLQDNSEPQDNVIDFVTWVDRGDRKQIVSLGGGVKSITRQLRDAEAELAGVRREARGFGSVAQRVIAGPVSFGLPSIAAQRLQQRIETLGDLRSMQIEAGEFLGKAGSDTFEKAKQAMAGVVEPGRASRWRHLRPTIGGQRQSLSEFIQANQFNASSGWTKSLEDAVVEKWLAKSSEHRLPNLADPLQDGELTDEFIDHTYDFLSNELGWLVDDGFLLGEQEFIGPPEPEITGAAR